MTAGPDLLARIDGCIRELEAIRAAVGASLPAEDGDGSNRTIRTCQPRQLMSSFREAPAARAEAGPRLYTFNADPRFQHLRRLMEDEWTPQLISLLDIQRRDLPLIWDADFMLGQPAADGTDSYVLGEINVSSVFPIPDGASADIARRVADRLRSKL